MGSAASQEIDSSRQLLDDLDHLVQKQQNLMQLALKQAKTGATGTCTTEDMVRSRKIPKGSRVHLWKQDPSVTRIGIRQIHLAHNIATGPKDDLIEVVTQLDAANKDEKVNTPATADDQGDFLIDFDKDPFHFDLVNVYTIARMVVDMFVRDLRIDWKWQWDLDLPAGAPKTPLKIIAHAGEKPNAVYHRGKKVLKFYYFTNEEETTYLCRSFDIVSHETGHAILDALKPNLYAIHEGQAGALHEAFGDLTAIFTILDQMDLCEDVIAQTKGNLREARYVTAIGEQFASAMSENHSPHLRSESEKPEHEVTEVMGMRDANNNLKGSECGTECHALSNVFTGYIFDIVVAIFEWERNPREEGDAECLHRCARMVRRMLLLALFNTSDAPNFTDISLAMERAVDVIAKEDPGDVKLYKQLIVKFRVDRQLAVAGLPPQEETVDLGNY